MNKFKVFFTFLAFFWLGLCGFWAISQCFQERELAWLGVLINAWALPIWMLLRSLYPEKFAGDLRESPAFFGVLGGLAVILLSDAGRGWPVYLSIYNLLVVLVYLFHLTAIAAPSAPRLLPQIDAHFPDLVLQNEKGGDSGYTWRARDFCTEQGASGVMAIFIRGGFCADSRHLLAGLRRQVGEFRQRGVALAVFTIAAERPSADTKTHSLASTVASPGGFPVLPLDPMAEQNLPFIAPWGAPLWRWSWQKDATRPCAWLIDEEGDVIWRHLPGNYRTLPAVTFLRDQLYRVDE